MEGDASGAPHPDSPAYAKAIVDVDAFARS
jgi:hypothetical protein